MHTYISVSGYSVGEKAGHNQTIPYYMHVSNIVKFVVAT